MYAGPVLFEQGSSGVPVLVQHMDYMWSAMGLQHLANWTGVAFPFANYRWVFEVGW
jgi:hypothetical protein